MPRQEKYTTRVESAACQKFKKKKQGQRKNLRQVQRKVARKTRHPQLKVPVSPREEIMAHLGEEYRKLPMKEVDLIVSNWKKIKDHCIDKKFNLAKRLQFFRDLAVHKYPLFEVKPSHIAGAGRGVFVSRWYPFAPVGAMLPFTGCVFYPPPADCDCVWISDLEQLVLKMDEDPVRHHGNLVNNCLSTTLDLEASRRLLTEEAGPQDYRVAHCEITGKYYGRNNTHGLRMEMVEKALSGYEVLGSYGTRYRAGHRSRDFPELPGRELSFEEIAAERAKRPLDFVIDVKKP